MVGVEGVGRVASFALQVVQELVGQGLSH
jgi:hypothetical protein